MFKRSFHTSISRQKKFYDILQLNHRADKRTIKANYYKLSKKYHPDLNPNNEQAHKMFLQINEAYAVLGNEASKKKYDYECSSEGGGNSSMNTAARYSRTGGGGGNTQAWHFRNRRAPRNTGSTSAQEQAERMKNDKSGAGAGFNYNEHYSKHYEAEEHRRRQRMENAAARKRAAGDDSVPGKRAPGMENTWGRLWRLGVVLAGIAYAAQTINP